MTITNEAQLATSLETLLRVGFDYLGIIDHYDRILVALSALNVYSDKMHKCATVDDLLAYIVDACEIDSVRDALCYTIQTSKGGESRGVSNYVDTEYIGNDVPPVEGGTVSVSKFGYCHYISAPFIPSDIMVLEPLDGADMSAEFGLFIATQLNVAFEYANYNDSVTLRVLEDTKVEVPVTEKGEIDYKAVREKMRPIMEKARTHVDQLVTQYQRYKEKK